MKISSIFQFILGFILGLALLIGGSAAAAYFFLTRIASTPPKPVFSEEKPAEPATPANPENTNASASQKPAQANASNTQAKPKEQIEPGAFKAKVTWPQGLILRDEPSIEANRIGGVGYEWEIIILRNSKDGKWQRVRLPGNGQEGWVKAGNVEKVKEE